MVRPCDEANAGHGLEVRLPEPSQTATRTAYRPPPSVKVLETLVVSLEDDGSKSLGLGLMTVGGTSGSWSDWLTTLTLACSNGLVSSVRSMPSPGTPTKSSSHQ